MPAQRTDSFIRTLLAEFLEEYPFQPATAWWRAVELAHLLEHPLPGGWGLDVGCGDGRLTQIIDGHSPRVARHWVGIDPDPPETELARRLGFYAEVLTATADQIAQPDARFDFALSNSVLEHIPDVEPVLQEVARVLKPDAPFILTVPSADFHACLRGPSLARRRMLKQSRAEYLGQIDRRLAHKYYWDEPRWRQALRAAGFGDVELVPYFSADEVQRWETLSNLTAGILYELMRRRQPIEIQRSLGLRGRRMPRWAARPLAQILSRGVGHRAQSLNGGLIAIARRATSPSTGV